jgi:hypothetical protein
VAVASCACWRCEKLKKGGLNCVLGRLKISSKLGNLSDFAADKTTQF